MKALKILAYIIFGAILLSIVLVVGAMFALTSSWGQLKLLDYVNTQIPGKLAAKTLNLSLFGDQKIEGLTLSDKDGKVILSVDKILVQTPIATMAATREMGGSAQVEGLQATLTLTPNGSFNVNEALGLPGPEIKAAVPFAPVIIKNVNATLKVDGNRNAVISATGLTEQGSQKGSFEITGEGGNSPQVHVKAIHFPVAILDQIAALKNPQTAGLFLAAIGDSIDFNVQQSVTPEGASFQGDFKSTNLSGNLQGALQGDTIILRSPSQINYTLTPSFYQQLRKVYPSAQYPEISQAIPVNVAIDDVTAKFANGKFDLFNSVVKANLNAGPGQLELRDGQGKIDLSELKVTFVSLKGEPKALITVTTTAKHNGAPLNLNLQANIQKPKDNNVSVQQILKALKVQAELQGVNFMGKSWDARINSETDGSKANALITLQMGSTTLPEIRANVNYSDLENIRAQMTIAAFPVSILNDFVQEKDLAALIGQTFALNLSGTFNQNGHGKYTLNFQGDNAQAKAAVDYNGKFTLMKGADSPFIELQVSPDQFAQIHTQWISNHPEASQIKLAKPMTVSLTIPELQMNLNDPKSGADFKAEINVSDVAVIDPVESKKLTLGKIQGQVQTQENSSTLSWNLNINGLGEGSMILAGTLPSPFATSDFSLQNLDFNVHMESQGVPIGVATRFAGFDPKWSKAVEAIFGSRVEIKADTNLSRLNGPVKASIVGDNGSIELDGRIANGLFLLNTPLIAKSKVTPQFGKDVFGLVLPILNSALSAENPIQIQVNPQGFAFPISPYDFHRIAFTNASISLGKINFSNQGELAQLLGLLNVKSQDQFTVWFTPAYISLYQSVLKIERFDMLAANQYPLAVWGDIDFPRDYVNVEIGLTGKAIGQAMGIKGLSADEMLIVPFRGPVGGPRIDKTKVATQISRIAIESQVPEGRLIGGILGIASGVLGGDTQPPPPTTQPLPWDTGTEKKKENKDNKVEKVIDKVQKKVEKGVGSLLNSLIPN